MDVPNGSLIPFFDEKTVIVYLGEREKKSNKVIEEKKKRKKKKENELSLGLK